MQPNLFLNLKYPEGFDLKDCLENEELKSFFPENYLPIIHHDLTSDEKPFLQVREKITDGGELYSVYNLYIRKNGQIANYPESAYVQLPLNLNSGFIARFRLPVSARVPNNLDLVYFIPLISVPYRVISDVRGDMENSVILSSDMMIFDSIEISKYPHVTFDDMIVRWMDRREELLEFFGVQ